MGDKGEFAARIAEKGPGRVPGRGLELEPSNLEEATRNVLAQPGDLGKAREAAGAVGVRFNPAREVFHQLAQIVFGDAVRRIEGVHVGNVVEDWESEEKGGPKTVVTRVILPRCAVPVIVAGLRDDRVDFRERSQIGVRGQNFTRREMELSARCGIDATEEGVSFKSLGRFQVCPEVHGAVYTKGIAKRFPRLRNAPVSIRSGS